MDWHQNIPEENRSSIRKHLILPFDGVPNAAAYVQHFLDFEEKAWRQSSSQQDYVTQVAHLVDDAKVKAELWTQKCQNEGKAEPSRGKGRGANSRGQGKKTASQAASRSSASGSTSSPSQGRGRGGASARGRGKAAASRAAEPAPAVAPPPAKDPLELIAMHMNLPIEQVRMMNLSREQVSTLLQSYGSQLTAAGAAQAQPAPAEPAVTGKKRPPPTTQPKQTAQSKKRKSTAKAAAGPPESKLAPPATKAHPANRKGKQASAPEPVPAPQGPSPHLVQQQQQQQQQQAAASAAQGRGGVPGASVSNNEAELSRHFVAQLKQRVKDPKGKIELVIRFGPQLAAHYDTLFRRNEVNAQAVEQIKKFLADMRARGEALYATDAGKKSTEFLFNVTCLLIANNQAAKHMATAAQERQQQQQQQPPPQQHPSSSKDAALAAQRALPQQGGAAAARPHQQAASSAQRPVPPSQKDKQDAASVAAAARARTQAAAAKQTAPAASRSAPAPAQAKGQAPAAQNQKHTADGISSSIVGGSDSNQYPVKDGRIVRHDRIHPDTDQLGCMIYPSVDTSPPPNPPPLGSTFGSLSDSDLHIPTKDIEVIGGVTYVSDRLTTQDSSSSRRSHEGFVLNGGRPGAWFDKRSDAQMQPPKTPGYVIARKTALNEPLKSEPSVIRLSRSVMRSDSAHPLPNGLQVTWTVPQINLAKEYLTGICPSRGLAACFIQFNSTFVIRPADRMRRADVPTRWLLVSPPNRTIEKLVNSAVGVSVRCGQVQSVQKAVQGGDSTANGSTAHAPAKDVHVPIQEMAPQCFFVDPRLQHPDGSMDSNAIWESRVAVQEDRLLRMSSDAAGGESHSSVAAVESAARPLPEATSFTTHMCRWLDAAVGLYQQYLECLHTVQMEIVQLRNPAEAQGANALGGDGRRSGWNIEYGAQNGSGIKVSLSHERVGNVVFQVPFAYPMSHLEVASADLRDGITLPRTVKGISEFCNSVV